MYFGTQDGKCTLEVDGQNSAPREASIHFGLHFVFISLKLSSSVPKMKAVVSNS
jgi:hypothetical protein